MKMVLINQTYFIVFFLQFESGSTGAVALYLSADRYFRSDDRYKAKKKSPELYRMTFI